MDAEVPETTTCIVVKSLAGADLFKFTPVPPTVGDLKCLIAESGYMPAPLQKLLHEDGFAVCADIEALEPKDQGMILLQDDTPLWFWDLESNHSKAELDIEGSVVKCPKLNRDYCNVVTKEPISTGLHYFEFHLHHYGDEQWCGLTPDKTMAGGEREKAVPSKNGCMYYTGRQTGAIEAFGKRLKECKFAERSNSIIGMLVDCGEGAVAFDLNGEIQGACKIEMNTRLWVLTHVDTKNDHVELRKPSLQDAPPSNFDALKGALLDVSQGHAMTRSY